MMVGEKRSYDGEICMDWCFGGHCLEFRARVVVVRKWRFSISVGYLDS